MKKSLLLIAALLLTAFGSFAKISPAWFFVFVPLLALEDEIFEKKQKASNLLIINILFFIAYSFFSLKFLVENYPVAYVAISLITGIIYGGLFTLFHVYRKKINNFYGYFLYLGIPLSLERFFLALDSPLSSLVLGNHISNLFWYSYTGSLGGSLWILIINLLIFNLIKTLKPLNLKNLITGLISTAIVILIPVFAGISIKKSIKPKEYAQFIYTKNKNPEDFFSGLNKTAKNLLPKIQNRVDFIITETNRMEITDFYNSDNLKSVYKLSENKTKQGIVIFERPHKNKFALPLLTNNSVSTARIYKQGVDFFSKRAKHRLIPVVQDSVNIGFILANDIYNGSQIRKILSHLPDVLVFYGKTDINILKNRAIEQIQPIVCLPARKIILPDGETKDFNENQPVKIPYYRTLTYYFYAGEYIGNLLAFLSIIVILAGLSKMAMKDEQLSKTIR